MSNHDEKQHLSEIREKLNTQVVMQERTERKFITLFRILSSLPATFSVIQERAGSEGKKMSTSLLARYLKDLRNWGLIKKNINLYYFDKSCLRGIYVPPETSPTFMALQFHMPIKCKTKKILGDFETYESTYAKLMGWDKSEKTPI